MRVDINPGLEASVYCLVGASVDILTVGGIVNF